MTKWAVVCNRCGTLCERNDKVKAEEEAAYHERDNMMRHHTKVVMVK